MKYLILFSLSLNFFDSFAQVKEELEVYNYYILHEENEPKCGFVVLSDAFPYADYQTENIIAPENLGEFEYTNDNYHEVKGVYRERFLNELSIKDSDILFVNNLNQNKVSSFKVIDLKLTAHLTPYGPNSPIENWDYLIGFELDSTQLPFKTPETYNQTIFSCVAAENPFNAGKAVEMIWEKVDTSEFIWQLTPEEKPKYMLLETRKDVYRFNWDGKNFYVQEVQTRENMFGYHLVVADENSNKKISSAFFFESESTYLQPLNGQKNSGATLQFTGFVFKNKPPIIYGFTSNTFGCPYISFAGKNEKSIWLKCDNRH